MRGRRALIGANTLALRRGTAGDVLRGTVGYVLRCAVGDVLRGTLRTGATNFIRRDNLTGSDTGITTTINRITMVLVDEQLLPMMV